jgi:nicotinamide mononucleotide (NMN) deamidase PncC
MWQDQLKELDINIHVIATGAGSSFQNELWEVCGSSSYFSGASFPYSITEQAELLGFTSTKSVCAETAIDLASAAYMKAIGTKQAVGIGLTASVASNSEHRGDHQVYVAIMTDSKVLLSHKILSKGTGNFKRSLDNIVCSDLAYSLLTDALDISPWKTEDTSAKEYQDVSDLAMQRLFTHPFFTANEKKLSNIPNNKNSYYQYHPYALMSGAYNPPHVGHFNMAETMLKDYGLVSIFEITTNPPHKETLSV